MRFIPLLSIVLPAATGKLPAPASFTRSWQSRCLWGCRPACRWFQAAKLTGIRQTSRDGDKVIVPDPDAPPLWARFYEIGTNRPIFSGRDGVVKYDVSQIEHERRNGYAWYGGWGAEVLAEWPRWKKKHGL